MTTPRGESGGETEGPVAARPDPAAGAESYPVWITPLAWGLALLVLVALSGLAAMMFRASGPVVEKVADRVEAAASDLRPTPEVAPLPGLPPARPETVEVAGDDGGFEPDVVMAPAWLIRPGGQFPEKALRRGVEYGEVQLDCPVDESGMIASCWILSETPANAGFGKAALQGAVQARLSPRTVNGEARSGRVRFTTRFDLR